MPAHPHIAGVILAGGTAQRMFGAQGGGDKGLADLAGKPMLAHVVERFRPQVAHVALNANGMPHRFGTLGLEIIGDHELHAGRGPLAGLAAAFDWAASLGQTSAVASVSTDVPFLPLDLVQRLAEASHGGARAAIAQSNDRWHPVVGLWPLTLADDLVKALHEGRRSAFDFAKRHGAVAVSFPLGTMGGQAIDPFFNANTPEDLQAARELLAGER
jgi:molybdopterin-guanine dinucleotide biosynthesis protein A